MNKIICYLNSNYINIYIKNKKYHIICESIYEGNITNKNLFISELKCKKIFSNFFTNSVDIYLNHIIEEQDIIYYKLIFEDLNCSNINIMDTSKKFISPTLINSNNIYILYYNNDYYRIIPKLLSEYLKVFNIKYLRIISNTKIKNNNRIKFYYYNNIDDIFIN